MKRAGPRKDEIVFVIALSCVVIGAGLLSITTGLLGSFIHLWPFLLLGSGAVMLFFAFARNLLVRFVFIGSLSFLMGLVGVIDRLCSLEFAMSWPLYAIAIGLSILLPGFKKYGRVRAGFFIPSIIFVVIGLVFSLFSFGIVEMSFRDIVIAWWPFVIVFAGVVLFMVYAYNRFRFRKKNLQEDGK